MVKIPFLTYSGSQGGLKLNKFIISGIVMLLVIPLSIAGLMYFPLLNFAKGTVESWLSFWGSYMGAIIGASVVYFVSKYQIRKQNHDAVVRDNKNYMRRLKIEKNHETISELIALENNLHEIVEYLVNLNSAIDIDLADYANDMMSSDNFNDSYNHFYNKSLLKIEKMDSFKKDILSTSANLRFLKVFINEFDGVEGVNRNFERMENKIKCLIENIFDIVDRIIRIYKLEDFEDGVKDLIKLDDISLLSKEVSSLETEIIKLLRQEINNLNETT